MNNVLLVGCSFVEQIQGKDGQLWKQTKHFFDVCGMSGSGNQAIAAQVMYKMARKKYDKVIVLWSGINRIDIPLGYTVHHHYMHYPEGHPCYSQVGDHFWYHSGGFGCSGIDPPTPDFMREYFHYQYREPRSDYFTDLSLQNVLLVNTFLKTQNIPFYSSFIYDIHANYTPEVDKFFEHSLDYTLGRANPESKFLPMLDDTLILTDTPYEVARRTNSLGNDKFHPTQSFMIDYVSSVVIDKLK